MMNTINKVINSTRRLNFLRAFVRRRKKKKKVLRGKITSSHLGTSFSFFVILFILNQSQQNGDLERILNNFFL